MLARKGTTERRIAVLAVLVAIVASAAWAGTAAGAPTRYNQLNLVSDIPGVARITDPNLVNAWGLAAGPSTPLWVNDNGTNLSTLYAGGVNGSIPAIVPLAVGIPGGGAPTGIVFNGRPSFRITDAVGTGPARFIFDSEAGKLTAWRPTSPLQTTAVIVGGSPTAVYKGLASAHTSSGDMLYAANFHDGSVDVWDSRFMPVNLGAGAFTDPNLPAGYAPFDIQRLGGSLYVSYAKQNAQKHDDVAGPGHGFVDVYSFTGHLVTRLISRGALNSPWGLAIAPSAFGMFSHDLLVGNFGDGLIHAYDPMTGAMLGTLTNTDGNPIQINGLWGLRPGNGVFASRNAVIFSAGIGDESHGLLGEITRAPGT